MKYYSEELKKVFDTKEELEKAEEQKKQELVKKENAAAIVSKEKKELAKKIETADQELTEAYSNLDAAREKAREIQKEALKKIEDILRPAEEEVKSAQCRKLDAVREFNKKYGVFTTTLTGQKAAEEMSRVWKSFEKLFGDFFF